MRRIVLVSAVVAWLAVPMVAPAFAQPAPRGALIVALPEDAMRALLERHPAAVGIGVYPSSRGARAFLDAIAVGDERVTAPGPPLDELLRRAGRSVAAAVSPLRDPGAAVALVDAVGSPETVPIREALAGDVVAYVTAMPDDAAAVIRLAARPTFVVGVAERTPVLVARLQERRGVLVGADSPRRGLLTPGDVRGAILHAAGVASDGSLGSVPHPDPLVALDALAEHLERNEAILTGLALVTVAAGIGTVVVATIALAARRRRLAAAFVRAGAMIPAGYVGGLFAPGDSWEASAVVLAGAFALGLALAFRDTRRTCGWILLGTAVGIAVLAVIAAARPDAEPALSLWGDPLNTWRFFGLPNHLAGFIAGGVVIGATLLAASAWMIAALALVLLAVVGAPTIGANYVAVAWFALGAAIATLARATGRLRLIHLPIAALVGVLAMAGALFADARVPASHGGRAVEAIRSDGVAAAWEAIRFRASLNVQEVRDAGLAGAIAFPLATLAVAALLVWAFRSRDVPPWIRGGVAGASAAALVALVVEDSGFLVGSQMGLFPWIGWAAFRLDLLRAREAPEPSDSVPVEPSLPPAAG